MTHVSGAPGTATKKSTPNQMDGTSVTAMVTSAMSRPTVLPSTTDTAAMGRKKKKR
jgi:hypothetical protein